MASPASSALKFFGGVLLGAAVGAGIYFVVTSDDEQGVVHHIKERVRFALEEGRRAMEARRQELEQELGFSLEDEPPLPLPPPPPAE